MPELPVLIEFQTEACNLIQQETLAQVFSCEFCEILKNSFFIENHCWVLLNIYHANRSSSCTNHVRFRSSEDFLDFSVAESQFQKVSVEKVHSQSILTCSKSTIRPLEQCVIFVQSYQNKVNDTILVSLLFTL